MEICSSKMWSDFQKLERSHRWMSSAFENFRREEEWRQYVKSKDAEDSHYVMNIRGPFLIYCFRLFSCFVTRSKTGQGVDLVPVPPVNPIKVWLDPKAGLLDAYYISVFFPDFSVHFQPSVCRCGPQNACGSSLAYDFLNICSQRQTNNRSSERPFVDL